MIKGVDYTRKCRFPELKSKIIFEVVFDDRYIEYHGYPRTSHTKPKGLHRYFSKCDVSLVLYDDNKHNMEEKKTYADG